MSMNFNALIKKYPEFIGRFRNHTSFFLIFALFFNCSLQKTAVRITSNIIDEGMSVVYEMSDLAFAETAMPASLLQIEIFLKSDPGNKKLLLNAIEGYTGYALGFVEDEDPKMAIGHYAHARDYGISLLSLKSEFKKGLEGNTQDLKDALLSARNEDVPALFWTANAWGSYINLKSDIESLAQMGKVKALMSRVIELDETFYFGSAHVFLGVVEASKGFVGNQELAKSHFDRALEISEEKFFLSLVLYARYFAVMNDEKELFTTLLQKVLEMPGDVLPEFRLINEIAKRKARLYLDNIGDWFE